jgi:hypothetical protein
MPQIENTYPAGVKRVGYASEISPTLFSLMIDVLLNALTTIVTIVAKTFKPWNIRLFD